MLASLKINSIVYFHCPSMHLLRNVLFSMGLINTIYRQNNKKRTERTICNIKQFIKAQEYTLPYISKCIYKCKMYSMECEDNNKNCRTTHPADNAPNALNLIPFQIRVFYYVLCTCVGLNEYSSI